MQLEYSVLGKDVEITDTSIPVISPNWRLKRNGDWTLLCRYEHEQINYSMLSPLMGATLSLMDGRMTFRHLCLVVQYAHDLESIEKSKELVTKVIMAANKESDAIVDMRPELEPYVKKIDPLEFVTTTSKWKQQKRPAAPISLNLMFSNDCETNCAYCYAHRRYVPESQLLSTKRWKEILKEAKNLGIDQVTLSGGDPLFRKDALTLVAEMIKLEMLFLLSTKCYISEEIAERLVEIGMAKPINQYVREIQISMDGPDEKTADRLAGSPGYYTRAVQSIRNLLVRGFNLRVKAVVTPLNAKDIYRWIKQLAEMGVTRVSVAAYNRTYHRHNDNLFLSQEDRISIAEQCERARSEFPDVDLRMTGLEKMPPVTTSAILTSANAPFGSGSDPDKEINDKIKRWKERAQCSGGRSSMTITPDGKVVLCDTVPQDESFFVGDVTNQTILEVWNSEPLLDFAYPPREKFKGSPCYDCKDLEECQSKAGYCFRDSYFNYGTVFGPPPKCPMAHNEGMRME